MDLLVSHQVSPKYVVCPHFLASVAERSQAPNPGTGTQEGMKSQMGWPGPALSLFFHYAMALWVPVTTVRSWTPWSGVGAAAAALRVVCRDEGCGESVQLQ